MLFWKLTSCHEVFRIILNIYLFCRNYQLWVWHQKPGVSVYQQYCGCLVPVQKGQSAATASINQLHTRVLCKHELFMCFVAWQHWIANNLFGLAFALNGVELLHLNNVSTGCILLGGLFVYDIFWVSWSYCFGFVCLSFWETQWNLVMFAVAITWCQ